MSLLCLVRALYLKKSCKFNKIAQNSFFYVKIRPWILTTNFMKIAIIEAKKEKLFDNLYSTARKLFFFV